MRKSLIAAFVLAFLFMSIIVFDMTIDRFYPEEKSGYLSSYLGSKTPSEFPIRNLVVFFIYLVIGFALVILSFQMIHSSLLTNLFAWTGLYFVVWSNYKLRYSSAYGLITGALTPPAWTLIVQWISLIAIIFLGYKLQHLDDKE